MALSPSIKEDLLWWEKIFANPTQSDIIRSGRFALEIFTDASLTGWGAICGKIRTHGFWSAEENKNHVNFLELLAVFHALRSFVSQIRGCDILLREDNSTALKLRFGRFDIDLFTSSNNAECPRFVSWLPDPLAFAIEAFSLDWGNFYFYSFLLFVLITRVLRKIVTDRAEGIMVVPRLLTQPCPLFNRLVCNHPLYFEPDANMFSSSFREVHPACSKISLVVAKAFPPSLFAKGYSSIGVGRDSCIIVGSNDCTIY
ncbi:hypothetical protein ALC57_01098 [Trachymyrmex cornetzi]|uniref:RNase H type-1 domain-containing protein n=1 Tax=Trachymyrmex cornetzi TaxID=471704 RepID=A0A151JQR8_9HYME|nr:hypothetical protein ALC57_01098 [Trachymyrmex cornetzi]